MKRFILHYVIPIYMLYICRYFNYTLLIGIFKFQLNVT